MDHTYWHRQTTKEPLFPDLLWSRPEHTKQAGKLLIIGGNAHGLSAPAAAFTEAEKAGIGTARVLLPDSLQKTVGKVFVAGEFAPSTPSGSFSKLALDEFLMSANWADGVLLAGDIGRNSETAILLETFLTKYTGQLTITKDAADYFTASPGHILSRSETTLVISFAQLQKIASQAHFKSAFTFDMDFVRLVDTLHEFTEAHSVNIVIKHLETMFVAVRGQVSSTKLIEDMPIWRVKTATHCCVWWLQNPTKPFEALTTALIQ